MMTSKTPDTSVIFSLAELAQIEEERVRDEETQRARARADKAREQRVAAERERAEEEARIAAENAARAERQRVEAEEEVRRDAREKAAVEVARIAAEAKARLEADNAVRAHELKLLQVRGDRGRRRLRHALAAVIGLVVCGASAAAYGVSQHVSRVELESNRVRDAERSLRHDHEQAMAAALAMLQTRHEALAARGAEEPEVAAARRGIDSVGVDAQKLRAFATALDGWQAHLDAAERLGQLDGRKADLDAWAAKQRRGDAVEKVNAAAARAHASTDGETLAAYETALDAARSVLAAEGGTHRVTGAGERNEDPGPRWENCSNPKDPMCVDGKILRTH
jgi:hypothetical protein